ncbi:hypothetical protein VXQ18_07835 [Brucella abortus]|nr:hypothetical protein [Brucella abortus]
MVDLPPKREAHRDAIQSFVSQETPIIVTITGSDGCVVGTGYSWLRVDWHWWVRPSCACLPTIWRRW